MAAWMRFALFCTAGAVASCSFVFDAAWPLLILALAGLIVGIEQRGGSWLAFVDASAFALGLYGAGLHWLFRPQTASVVPYVMAGGLVVVLSMGLGSVLFLATRLRVRLEVRWMVATPAAVVLFEWLRTAGPVPFPWLGLGYSQSPGSPLAAYGALAGVLGVAAATVCSAGAVAVLVLHAARGRRDALGYAVGGLVVIMAASIVVASIAFTAPTGEVVRVGLAQADFPLASKTDPVAVRRLLERIVALVRASDAQVTLLPETSVPLLADELPADFEGALSRAVQAHRSDLVMGLYEKDLSTSAGYFSSAFSLGSSGAQRYRKRKLVPFGETVPLAAGLRAWFEARLGMPFTGASPGARDQPPWWLGGTRLVVMLCYDAAFGDDLRSNAAAAGWLADLADDGWVDSRWLVRQHLRVSQARAAEFAKPVARVANSGLSASIDWRGRVVDSLDAHESAVLTVRLEPRSGLTPYARFGDLPVVFAALTAFIAALAETRLRPKSSLIRGSRPWGRAMQGQVLPLGLFFIFATAAVMLLMVSSGQLVKEKLRVTSAADAAAWSAGVVQARALNFTAYANRAIVANQVAIAQAVSLASWVGYLSTFIENGALIAGEPVQFGMPALSNDPLAAGILQASGALGAAAEYYSGGSVSDYVDYVRYVTPPLVSAHDLAAVGLGVAERAVMTSLSFGVYQGTVAQDVAQRTDPALRAEVVLGSYTFDGLTRRYDDDERQRLSDVVTHSIDPFTRSRDWDVRGVDIPFIQNNISLRRRGGTALSSDFSEWRSMDTFELHGQHFGCGKLHTRWCDDVATPLAWGAASASAPESDPARGDIYRRAYDQNGEAAAYADSALFQMSEHFGLYSGLQGTYDVAHLDPADEARNTAGITIMVSKPKGALMTSGNASQATPAGRLDVYGGAVAGGLVASLSRSQVFFEPPLARSADTAAELSSLYSPYWQVRLVAAGVVDYAWAAARQGGRTLGPPLASEPKL
ncbi:hypothetical protein BH10PSE17_BH10PSE17_01520 [soil metagenome]